MISAEKEFEHAGKETFHVKASIPAAFDLDIDNILL